MRMNREQSFSEVQGPHAGSLLLRIRVYSTQTFAGL